MRLIFIFTVYFMFTKYEIFVVFGKPLRCDSDVIKDHSEVNGSANALERACDVADFPKIQQDETFFAENIQKLSKTVFLP